MRKTISLVLALLMLVSVMPIAVIAANDACEHINTVTEEAIPSTCTEQGFTEGVYCNDCGEWLVAQEKTPVLEHLWGNYIYNNDATCVRNGTTTAICNYGCGSTETREVYDSRLEHEYEAVVTKAANCKEEGLIAYTCDCGYAYTNTVSKTDHADDNIDDVCDVCGEVLNSFSGQCGENVYWEFDESTDTLTISGAGKIDDAIVFDEETGDFVANEEKDFLVNMPWYHLKNQIRTIVIEEGITEIGACAFHSLFYLTKVEFPSTLEVVGCAAFCDCIRLEELDLPDSVNTLYVSNYNEIAIKKIVLPESLEATPTVPGIDEVFDFNMCAYLESITVPEEIGAIEAVIDISNPSIRNIYNYSTEALIKFDAHNELWYGDEATAEYMTVVMGAGLSSIESEMTEEELQAFVLEKIIEYYGEDYAEEIPEPVYSETVPDYIKIYCYENSAQHNYCVENNIDCVLIDENTHLDPLNNDGVCDVCGLNNMCGEKVYYEFDDITGTVTISGEGSTYNYERYGTKFEDVQSPFYNDDNIRKVIIEEGITSLGDYLFFGCCNIEEIQIPETVTYIGERTVDGKMTQFNIGKNISYVDGTIEELGCVKKFTVDAENANYSADNFGCLYNKNMMSLEAYPADNDATEFTIPESVEFVNADFDCANKLEFVYIHKDVKSLSDGIFTSAFNLKKIIVDKNNERYFNDEYGALYSVIPETGEIILKCYPSGNIRAVFEIADGTNTIWHSVFNGDTSINTLIIPASVNRMVWGALPYYNVDNIYYLNDIYYYGTEEQWDEIEINETNNQVLENVTIHCNYDGMSPIIVKRGSCGDNVTYEFYSDGTLIISGTGAMADNFFEFSKLDIKNVIIKSGVTTIAGWAFSRCSMLTAVTISGSVTSIGDSVFSSCDSLSDIVIPDSVKSIGKAAFFSCDNLTSITIPDSVTSIGDGSFCDCKGLTSITFGKSVKSIGKDAFDDCINLTDVYFKASKNEWNSIIIRSGNDSLLDATIHFNDCRHTEDGYATITKDENINEPTYTKDGSYDEVTICENCGAELGRETKAIPDLSLLETIVGNIEETFKGFYDALARVITKLLMLIKKMG